MRYLLSKDAQLAMAEVGQMPVLSALGDEVTSIHDYYGVFVDQLATARPRPPTPAWPQIDQVLQAQTQHAFRGDATVQEALDGAADADRRPPRRVQRLSRRRRTRRSSSDASRPARLVGPDGRGATMRDDDADHRPMTTTSFAPPRRRRSGPAGTRRSRWAGLAFVAPGFAVYALIMLYPAVRAVLISLRDYNIVPGASSPFVGLDNYTRALHDPVLRRSFVNAAFYTAVTVPAQVVIGLFLAVLLDARLPGRTLFRVLFYLPVVTSWVVVSLLFQYLFATDRGFVNWVLRRCPPRRRPQRQLARRPLAGDDRHLAARHLEGRRLVDADLPRRAHRRAARAARGRRRSTAPARRGASATSRCRSSAAPSPRS